MLNIARLLSRVSLDMACAGKIVMSNHMPNFLAAMIVHKNSSAILIRLAYILGSLTTNFEEARIQLCEQKQTPVFETILDLGIFYLQKMKDGQGHKTPATLMSSKKEAGSVKKNKGDLPSRYEEFTQGNLEDAVQKLIKLFANLATEEETAMSEFQRLK